MVITDVHKGSKPHSFRTMIKHAESWKIQSIAQYKRMKYLKQLQENSLKNGGIDSQDKKTLGMDKKKTNKMKNNIASNSTPPPTETPNTDSPPPSSAPQSKQLKPEEHQLMIEQYLKEVSAYTNQSQIIQNRITSMHTIKNSLHWLLRRAIVHERSLINDCPQLVSSSYQVESNNSNELNEENE